MLTFSFVQNSIRSAAFNLAIEEAIGLHLVSSGYGAGLRIWKNPFSIVLGLSEKAEDTILPEILLHFQESKFSGMIGFKDIKSETNLNLTQSRNDHFSKNSVKNFQKQTIESNSNLAQEIFGNNQKTKIESFKSNSKIEDQTNLTKEFPMIVRRASGGGTVVHHPDENLNFTFFISLDVKPELYKVKESYDYFLSLVLDALKRQTLGASFRGKSDLAVLENGLEKKISGNAQFRKRGAVVHHGTLILKPSLIERVSKLLKHPPEEPEYRKNRKHSDFVTSLPDNFSTVKFGQDLSHVFAESLGLSKIGSESDLRFQKVVFQEAKLLFENKYSRMDFIFRD
ncbi:biotin/lipoate A/B protein ligase family protein [Leptospira interrogans serovar Valbuzzi str. Duyster]|uniref:lipoate--protein ligase family protein n=1 Tax=Leptospira interrogans TaxID=173 RepID=UPI0002BF74A4|nr:biotin/lipoate A/B protein ligase [Leptospira interrogans]EMJ53642.1 biotin/lipoate A/B protein ligase family protein [Leptospira interrogans serovar Valbuzzi str. Duyster]ENO73936.1 biotin/lipoate A/B protein ligase family protein [Leptospira interrogans serovar Valbuzzi str. Valbuzzi]